MRSIPVFSLLLLASPVLAVPPDAPTSVVAYAPNQNRIHVSWVDNATDETDYRVERRIGAGSWTQVALLPANFEVYRGTASTFAEETYKFRITALKGAEASTVTESQSLVKPTGPLDLFIDPGFTDPMNPLNNIPARELPEGSGARAGFAVNQQILVFNGTPTSFTARDLAPGLTFSESTGVISGTVATPGVYRIFVGVLFDTDKKFEQVRFLRVLPGVSTPQIASPAFSLPKQNIGVSGFIDISGLFRDPARPKGAWFYTARESIIVALYDTATPKTVNNFLGYAARGDYVNSYVHRSVGSFIFQGGGYKPASATAAPTAWAAVTKQDEVQNEPGISNARRTISMAKLGGTRDSATCEWFFNTGSSNPANLDFQNGGFTAFGEVVGASSLGIADLINGLVTNAPNNMGNPAISTNGYAITIDGQARTFFDVPVLDPVTNSSVPPQSVAPVIPGANTFLKIDSIFPAPPVVITIVSNSAPTVLTAGIEGMLLYLESKGPIGTANLVLRATNLDGNSVDFTLPVSIDDLVGPGFRLTKIRGVNPPGTLLVKGLASDAVGLGFWRYRVNKGRWIRAQTLKGKTSPLTTKMKGFKRGKNLIEFEVFDAKRNSSGVLKQTITFG